MPEDQRWPSAAARKERAGLHKNAALDIEWDMPWQCEVCALTGRSTPADRILVVPRRGPGLSRTLDAGSFCAPHAELAQTLTTTAWPEAQRESEEQVAPHCGIRLPGAKP